VSPPIPSFGASVGTIFQLHLRRTLRGNRVWIGAAAVLLIDIAIVLTRYLVDAEEIEPTKVVQGGISLGYFTLLAYLVPFLLASGAISEEVESRTYAYLSSRPVARSAITLGKYLASVALAAGLLVAGLVVLHLTAFITDPTPMVDEAGATARAMGGLIMLVFLYGAICMFWGSAAPDAAGLVSGLWLAILEFGLSLLPGVFRFGSMNYWATQIAGLPKGGMLPDTVPETDLWIAFVAIGIETLIFLALATVTVATSEFRYGKA
jgi:ABC-type transport system involved in multi-copper enzyme maturation permease subunit